MAVVDALTTKARNYIKKTGDSMISGFLTLFQDPTQALHAVTKQYADGLVSGIGSAIQPLKTGRFYGPTFATSSATFAQTTGDAICTPLFVGQTRTWTKLRARMGSTTTIHMGLYSLASTTLLPTALLVDVSFTSGGFATEVSVTINTTTTATWLGIASYIEVGGSVASSYTGTVNSGLLSLENTMFPTPWGKADLGGVQTDEPYDSALKLTGVSGSALPAASAWAAATYISDNLGWTSVYMSA